MNILALDLATHTGWAISEYGRRESGMQAFEVKRGESPGMRYLAFNRWLDGLVFPAAPSRGPLPPLSSAEIERRMSPRVELIVYEQPFVMRSGAAAEISLGFATRVQEFCARHGIEHTTLNGMTLKKWTTGRGNAKKPEMVAAVQSRFKWTGTDDNEADAVALLHHTLETLAVTVPF